MLHVRVLKIADDQVDRFRAWMAELPRRAEEVRETFANEGVRHEQAHLVSTSDGTLVVYAFEAEDVDAAFAAFRSSTLPIDLEHQQVMATVVEQQLDTELLLDLTASGV